MIFLGNGDHSAAQCYHLHRQLDRALDILSGMQQGGGTKQDAADVRFIAEEIYDALIERGEEQ